MNITRPRSNNIWQIDEYSTRWAQYIDRQRNFARICAVSFLRNCDAASVGKFEDNLFYQLS